MVKKTNKLCRDPNPHLLRRHLLARRMRGELQTTQPSILMMMWACFLAHNPRRSAILWWSRKSYCFGFCWVNESWSLPLKYMVPNGLYFASKQKKAALLLRISMHGTFEKFSPRNSSKQKQHGWHFRQFRRSSRPFCDLFFLCCGVYLIDFLSKTKFQKPWKGFGAIQKQLLNSFSFI